MKILMLSRLFPFPLNNGAKIRVYHTIKELSKHHEITLVTLYHEDNELNYLSELEKVCSNIYFFKLKFSKKLAALKSVFSKYPWDIVAFYNYKLKIKINKLLISKHFDIVYINFLSMTGNIDFNLIKKSIIVLDQHNVDELFWRNFSKKSKNIALRLFAHLNLLKLIRFQKRIIEKIHLILSVSEKDAEFMRNQTPNHNKVWVVPNGVDLNYFKPSNKSKVQKNVIMFCGSMDVTMNIEAVQFFADEIFPLIRKEIPDSYFYIVGRNPTKNVRNLTKNKNIIVTGNVDDVRPYYEKAAVFVAPFKLGGGTKLKILEAMAMKVPVVTTSLGCQGIDVINNVHIILENDIKKFSDTVIRLLKNKNEKIKLVNNGRKLVEKKYSWNSIVKRQNKKLSQLIKNYRGKKSNDKI